MFTHKCVLRKNTPEIRNYLVSIGYKDCVPLNSVDSRQFGLLLNKKTICGVVQDEEYVFNLDTYLRLNPDIIDCGTNEEMFKAIAALRDDKTPDYQWYVWDDIYVDNRFKQYIPGEHWEEWWWFEVHKATVEELIEHFK